MVAAAGVEYSVAAVDDVSVPPGLLKANNFSTVLAAVISEAGDSVVVNAVTAAVGLNANNFSVVVTT